jgi:hypothetical protein
MKAYLAQTILILAKNALHKNFLLSTPLSLSFLQRVKRDQVNKQSIMKLQPGFMRW